MTATAMQDAQQARAKICDKEWVRLFPKEATENYTSSLTFIKQLTVVAVSTITYIKNAFPEECYNSETFGGVKLKILKDKCQDELAHFTSTSMRQAFDAFDKKYISKLALCFYRGDCSADNLIEYHVFEYTYTPEGVALTLNSQGRGDSNKRALRCSLDSVKMRTAMLVRSLSLFVWQNCTQELPHNYDLSLRLYYNEDAPMEYQAPGFGASPEPDHLAATAHEALCLGGVETPFHKLFARCFVRDLLNLNLNDSGVATPSDSVPEMTQDISEDFKGSGARSPDSQSQSQAQSQSQSRSAPPAPAPLRCPCAQELPDLARVTCRYCHTQQHAVCFGLLAPVAEHCCADCAAHQPARTPSCPLLVGLQRRKQESLCIFRLSLHECGGAAWLRGEQLRARFQLSAASAAKMLRLLQSHQVLPHADEQDLAVPRKINPIRLKLVSKHFFRADEREQADSMVERLVAETADPVAAVLGPLEHVALQARSTPRVAEATPPSPERDATLRQYRAALPGAGAGAGAGAAAAAGDELPLSGAHNPVRDVECIGRRKRKPHDEDEDWTPSKLSKLRSGAKTKKKI